MKPSWHRYILAHAAAISAGLGIIVTVALMFACLHSEGALIPRAGPIIRVLLAAILTIGIGWLVGIFFLWGMIVGPHAARLQGWPFSIGDRVWILSGKHKDRITTVYAVWAERGQVRVDLGPEAREKVEDVYCAVEVCRADSLKSDEAVPSSGPTPPDASA